MRNDFESTYLAHHGILGMRWGKKNGPPYPLGAEDHSTSEKKAGYKKSLGGGRNEELYDRKTNSSANQKEKRHLTEQQKRYIKIGMAALGITAVAVGTVYLVKSGKASALINTGKSFINGRAGSDIPSSIPTNDNAKISKLFNKVKAQAIAKETGFKIKEKAGTLGDNLAVNGGNYKGGKNDPLRNNCAHSVCAWILNEIGLDVKANPMPDDFIDGGMTSFEFKRFFKGTSFSPYRPKPGQTADQVAEGIKQEILRLTNGRDGAGAWTLKTTHGHFLGWKVEGGQVTLVNPQIESTDCSKWFDDIADGLLDGDIQISNRLDNLTPAVKYIKTACRNA